MSMRGFIGHSWYGGQDRRWVRTATSGQDPGCRDDEREAEALTQSAVYHFTECGLP